MWDDEEVDGEWYDRVTEEAEERRRKWGEDEEEVDRTVCRRCGGRGCNWCLMVGY